MEPLRSHTEGVGDGVSVPGVHRMCGPVPTIADTASRIVAHLNIEPRGPRAPTRLPAERPNPFDSARPSPRPRPFRGNDDLRILHHGLLSLPRRPLEEQQPGLVRDEQASIREGGPGSLPTLHPR